MPACLAPGCWATRSTARTAGCAWIWSGASSPSCWPSAATRSSGRCWTSISGSTPPHAWPPVCRPEPGDASRRGPAEGDRLYDWARLRLTRLQQPPWEHWLLVRRSCKDPSDLAYYVVFGPDRTTLTTLAQVAGRRWAIEECFEVAKQEVGLADYEIRSWHGCYRHITLAMLALGFLAALRAKLNAATSHKRGLRSLDLWSPSAWARSASSLAACNVRPA